MALQIAESTELIDAINAHTLLVEQCAKSADWRAVKNQLRSLLRHLDSVPANSNASKYALALKARIVELIENIDTKNFSTPQEFLTQFYKYFLPVKTSLVIALQERKTLKKTA